jgi:6-pyruvoyltetrahydropterin/6-carboxytetrahydropterin synthase
MAVIKTVTRYHDFSYGHRILAPGPCSRLHGHNARVYFTVQGEVDKYGHIVDFAEIKNTYCAWLEDNWDHRMILHRDDIMFSKFLISEWRDNGLVNVDFQPTAENLSTWLLRHFRMEFKFPCANLIRIKWVETRKCSVEVEHKEDIKYRLVPVEL